MSIIYNTRQQDWDITTTFIASLISAEGHSLPDGCSFVVRVKKYPTPLLPEGQAGKYTPYPYGVSWHCYAPPPAIDQQRRKQQPTETA